MASQLVFEPFQLDYPQDWFTRMEAAHALLEASTGTTLDKKTFLLASIGSKASLLLADLLAPVSVQESSVDYAKVKTTLLSHLKAQHLEIAERANFYAATQGHGESASNFFSRLKKLAEFCNFGTSLDSMLRDRLVLGCRNMEARKRLLQIDPLNLQTVRDTLATHEAIDEAKHGGALADSGDIHFSKKTKTFPRNSRPKPSSCYRCGKQSCKHGPTCPAMGKQCTKCGKLNHFRQVCKSKPKESSVNAATDSLLHIDAVPTQKTDSRLSTTLNGYQCIMEIDTGASATIISSRMWRKMGSPSLKVSNRLFTAYDGHRMRPLGDLVDCCIETDTAIKIATITGVESTKDYGLLGRDILSNFAEVPIVTNAVVTRPLPAMKIDPVSIDIADPSKLRFCKARPVPLPMEDKVNAELQRLQDQGIIKPVSNSKYASPVVWVKKRDGTLRMCADFKVHLNRSIESDAYPMPAIETIFAGMSDAKVFAKLDLKDAYWQIPLDLRSRELCTINTSKGLFHMMRLPKGLKNSAAIFQRVMETILKNIPGVKIYQDDILIHAPSSDSLAKRVSSVFKRLEEKDITVNSSKSVLNATEVKFLGHHISSSGIRPDPRTTEKILSMKPPNSRSELETFLGLVNFFGRLIPNFSEIVQPLHALRKKDVQFQWSSAHQAAFNRLLQIMASPPVLASYELNQPATLTTDASEKAIAGILTQNGRPVMFVSRVLSPAEQRYSNIEREALAVVWSVIRLKQLLLGRHFYLVTDHKPLVKIYGGSLPKVVSNRLIRWSMLLQRYDFSILHQPGTCISHADALTRLQLLSDESLDEDIVINNAADDISDLWRITLQQATASDDLAQSLIRRVETNDWTALKPSEKFFFRIRNELTVENQLLYKSGKCFIPWRVRKDVFNDSHTLHMGIQSTVNRIKLSSWWPSLHSDVRKWIQNCPECAKLRPSSDKQLNPWPQNEVFERLHADWCHIPNIGNVLVVVDSASGWIECSLPQARTSTNVIETLSSIFSRFGVCKYLVTDNAPEFVSRELNDFCRSNGIAKMESPMYHAASNGPAERGVQTIKKGMRAWSLDVAHLSFKEYMKRLLLHHRACCQRPDGRTPAEIVYSRKIRVPLSRNFLFSQPIAYKSRGGSLRDGTFLLERGSNTSWVLDEESNRLRLAHHDQISNRPTPSASPQATLPGASSTPVPAATPATASDSTAAVATPVLPTASSPVSATTPPVPSLPASPAMADPDATLPMTIGSPTLATSPAGNRRILRRNRKQKVISDYEDL